MCFLEAMFIIALMFSLPFVFVTAANIKYAWGTVCNAGDMKNS